MLLQLLISMEVFGKIYGELHLYTTTEKTDHSLSHLHTVIGVKKTVNIFNEKFIKYACIGYINYLVLVFNILNIEISKEVHEAGLKYLQEACYRSKSYSITAKPIIETSMCQQVLSSFECQITLTAVKPLKELL